MNFHRVGKKNENKKAENSFIKDKNEPYVEYHFFRKARKSH